MVQSMPSQPKTFKEYRKIKEEQEKQRREHQNNLRKQQEEKERKIKEEKESRLKAEEVKEEKNKELHVFTIDDYDDEDTMSAKELKQKRKEKLQKLAESKDPRKRKLLGKERDKEKKEPPPSAVIKSFKIPKVKKVSTEESNLVKPEKLAEVDIFMPLEIKNAPKTDLSQARKKRKLEKFITRPLKEDSSSEIVIQLKNPSLVQDLPSKNILPSSPSDDHKEEGDKTIIPADTSSEVLSPARAPSPAQASFPAPDPVIDISDSDSEPGLTIAEEVVRRLSRSSESDTHATPDRRVSRSSESEPSATPDKRVLQSSGSETLATRDQRVSRSSKNETLAIPDGRVSQSYESESFATPDKKVSIFSKSDGSDAPDKQISQYIKSDTQSTPTRKLSSSSKGNILSKPNRSISRSIESEMEIQTAMESGNHDPPEVAPLVAPSEVAPVEVAPVEVAPVKVALEEIAPEQVASEEVAPEEVSQEQCAPVEVAAEDLPAGPSSKPEISTLPTVSKSDLTKELLKSIVSTLDPAGAKKLLEKASRMDQVDKISLTDLRGLLAQDSTDSEDESPPMKVARKKSRTGGRNSEKRKAVKKVEKSQENIPPITSRTRQCKRQIVPDEQEVEGSTGKEEKEEIIPNVIPTENVDQAEDEEETFVIEPKAVRKRGVAEIIDEYKDEEETFVIEPKSVRKRGAAKIVDEPEDEEETFVIEPKAVKKRGRKKKAKAPEIHFELDNEDLQDDFISSSGFIEQMQEAKESKDVKLVKAEAMEEETSLVLSEDNHVMSPKLEEGIPVEDIKLETEAAGGRGSVDALSPTPAPGMRQTRSMRNRMAPKSKTWFPGDRGGSDTKKSIFSESALKSPPIKTDIKQEECPVDVNIFLGEGDVKDKSFLDNKFEFDPASLEIQQMEGLKNRGSKLLGIFDKITKQGQEQILAERNTVDVKMPEVSKTKREALLCSKIKLARPSKGVREEEEPLVPRPPVILPSLISRLSSLVSPVDIVEESERELKLPSFLGFVQDLRKASASLSRRPPPGLIPLSSSPPAITLLRDEQQRLAPLSACLSRQQLAQQKTSAALEQLLLPASLRHLFKCLLSSECSFTSDSAQEFLQHCQLHHPGCGPPQCAYCGGRVRDVQRLVTHTLRRHSQAVLQCCHCFHRAAQESELLVHQLVLHPALPRGYLACRSLATHPPPTVPSVTEHRVHCPIPGCPHDFPSSALHLLPQHINTHDSPHPGSAVQDCSCTYCDFTSTSSVKVLLHLSLTHPALPPRLRLRRTELVAEEEEEETTESEEEEEEESDTDSDLSDFDKHFYDEDIDTLDDLVKPLDDDEVLGLSEHLLYRCGTLGCTASAPTAAALRDHLAFCEHKTKEQDYVCYHCHTEHKHIPGLLEHIKTHAAKRLTCSLCSFRTNQMVSLKQHGRTEHKLTQLKFLPLKPSQTNAEEDAFVMVPKNTLPKAPRSRHVKEIYSPADISTIPIKPDVYKYLIRCSVCDFSTKVRFNLVKHLRLHKSMDAMLASGSLRVAVLPTLTPVNPPPILIREEESETNYKSLLPEDIDEELYRQPITEEDMVHMPIFVVENHRYACPTCAYITIDEIMLLDHISAVHPKMRSFACPHCPGLRLDFNMVELHMRCHSELLFKCGYCHYFHWQKRVAEAHVGSEHRTRKLFVKDVRANKDAQERKEAEKAEKEALDKVEKEEAVSKVNKLVYDPFKCGLCDAACETVEEIREHCSEQHGHSRQYKCSLCSLASDSKQELEEHVKTNHTVSAPNVMKLFYVDPSKGPNDEEKREPLWSRDMEGLKHIRGILYDEDTEELKRKIVKTAVKREKKEKREDALQKEILPHREDIAMDSFIDFNTSMDSSVDLDKNHSNAITKSELDFYPMQCKECGFTKKTVTGLKMHIKLNHLGVGKMQCRHCVFTANLKVSIHGHYRNKHPETITQVGGGDKFDYIERSSEAQTFSQEYWTDKWGIPSMEERRATLQKREGAGGHAESPTIKKKGKPGPKKGSKRKPKVNAMEPAPKELRLLETSLNISMDLTDSIDTTPVQELQKRSDQSPFEHRPSYMCEHCPRRSQNLEKLQNHVKQEHGDTGGWRQIGRDQVVVIITSDQYQNHSSASYKCFYCQETGDVSALKEHTVAQHPGQVLRVVRFQAQRVTGYLECQLCGHLTPGFEKHLQKTHFHEEHPMESDVVCSKYMSRTKTAGTEAITGYQPAFKVGKSISKSNTKFFSRSMLTTCRG